MKVWNLLYSYLYVPHWYIVVSFNKCTLCKSLWMKASAKCRKCKCTTMGVEHPSRSTTLLITELVGVVLLLHWRFSTVSVISFQSYDLPLIRPTWTSVQFLSLSASAGHADPRPDPCLHGQRSLSVQPVWKEHRHHRRYGRRRKHFHILKLHSVFLVKVTRQVAVGNYGNNI